MFKKILVSTDGSRLAAKGVRAAVKLAGSLGARVTGVYVAPPYRLPVYEGGMTARRVLSPADYKKSVERHARKVLAEVSIEAEAAGVPCNTRVATAESPWRGILEVAAKAGCDAIVMSSHGRSNLGGLLLGSETARVLSHSKIPVIVFR
jgi:nucleotide-binding universal stress UspA family protein